MRPMQAVWKLGPQPGPQMSTTLLLTMEPVRGECTHLQALHAGLLALSTCQTQHNLLGGLSLQ